MAKKNQTPANTGSEVNEAKLVLDALNVISELKKEGKSETIAVFLDGLDKKLSEAVKAELAKIVEQDQNKTEVPRLDTSHPFDNQFKTPPADTPNNDDDLPEGCESAKLDEFAGFFNMRNVFDDESLAGIYYTPNRDNATSTKVNSINAYLQGLKYDSDKKEVSLILREKVKDENKKPRVFFMKLHALESKTGGLFDLFPNKKKVNTYKWLAVLILALHNSMANKQTLLTISCNIERQEDKKTPVTYKNLDKENCFKMTLFLEINGEKAHTLVDYNKETGRFEYCTGDSNGEEKTIPVVEFSHPEGGEPFVKYKKEYIQFFELLIRQIQQNIKNS